MNRADRIERERAVAAEHGLFFVELPKEGIPRFLRRLLKHLDRQLYGRRPVSDGEAEILGEFLNQIFDAEHELRSLPPLEKEGEIHD